MKLRFPEKALSLNTASIDRTQGVKMTPPILPPSAVEQVWTSKEGSMARDTALNRWPRIVQGIVDDVAISREGSTEQERLEAEDLVQNLRSMKEEIVADTALT